MTLGKEPSVFTRIGKDGTGRERASDRSRFTNRGGISPDGEWAVLSIAGIARRSAVGYRRPFPARGPCPAHLQWPLLGVVVDDARFLHVSVFDESAPESTLVIPLPPGVLVPDFPETGMNVPANQHVIPGTRIIERGKVAPAPDPRPTSS